jgi:hypothetical protein
MGISMWGSTDGEIPMDMDNTNGRMEIPMLECSRMGKNMDRESGGKDKDRKEREVEWSISRCLKGSIEMIRRMDMENFSGLVGTDIRVIIQMT